MADGTTAMLSSFDYMLIAGVAAVGVYFLVFRKKKVEPAATFKPLAVGWVCLDNFVQVEGKLIRK